MCDSFLQSLSCLAKNEAQSNAQSESNSTWSENLTLKLPSFFNTSICGSTKVTVSDHSLECSKAILAAQSPVLEEYFSKSVEYSSRLILSEYFGSDDIVTEFFRAFYNGKLSLAESSYKISFKLCTQFNVAWMIQECRKFLRSIVTSENFIEEYIFASVICNPVLVQELQVVVRRLDYFTVTSHSKWNLLTKPQLISLLPHLPAPNEVLVCQDVFNWMEYEAQRKNSIYDVISMTRLGSLPINFLTTTIESYISSQYVETLKLLKMLTEAFRCVAMKNMGIPLVPSAKNPLKYYEARPSFRDYTELSLTIPSIRFSEELDSVKQSISPSISITVDHASQSFKLTFAEITDVVYCTCKRYVTSSQCKDLMAVVKRVDRVYESSPLKFLPPEDVETEELTYSYCAYND